jgi:hypothetical protein
LRRSIDMLSGIHSTDGYPLALGFFSDSCQISLLGTRSLAALFIASGHYGKTFTKILANLSYAHESLNLCVS